VAPNQNRTEILDLLRRLEREPPGVLCELGSAGGGTLFLLSRVARPDARLLSIDLKNGPERARRFELLVRSGQRLTCLEGDSHDPRIVARFHDWLGTDRLDFLLIDGDHSAAGVAADFETYAPAVRPGGLVALHDIVPDYRARYGVDTGADAGEVPAFWRRLKQRLPRVVELVEHPMQDGRGIGLIEV
jgi:predicted O-methyltransferase YrrM